MINWPDSLAPFFSEAKKLVHHGGIEAIEFSKNTYQIGVKDPSLQTCWVFIQFNEQNAIQDFFCSCEEDACLHKAAAFYRIYEHSAIPLHNRFKASFWNSLCLQAASVYLKPLKQLSKGLWEKKNLITVEAKSAQGLKKLQGILEKTELETEENSIKFSGLSEEELTLWQEGTPTFSLQYELSYWSDLAKWLLLLQDEEIPYTLSFLGNETSLPNDLKVNFPDVELHVTLQNLNFAEIIPSLATVKSPLKIHHPIPELLQKITYDEENHCLHLIPKKPFPKLKTGISVGNWTYVPHDGFHPNEEHEILDHPQKNEHEIANFLNAHANEITPLLDKLTLNTEFQKLSYHLRWDKKHYLWIEPYLFEPNDLLNPKSYQFDEWVYLFQKGFYRISLTKFPPPRPLCIPFAQVEEFIQQHKEWLNEQKDFHIHLTGIEDQIIYQFDKDKGLLFSKQTPLPIAKSSVIDFGSWIHVKGQGFYAKRHVKLDFPFRPGVWINPERIADFIRNHEKELQVVPNFFTNIPHLKSVGLKITLIHSKKISLEPSYELNYAYQGTPFDVYGDYLYIENEGFEEIPPHKRIPEPYKTAISFEGKKLIPFFKEEFPKIRHLISNLDLRFTPPKTLQLIADNLTDQNKLYQMELHYHTENGDIPVPDLIQAIKKHDLFLFANAGRLDLFDSRFDWIREALEKKSTKLIENQISLSALELFRMQAFEDLQSQGTTWEKLKQLAEMRNPEPINLQGLKSVLRPYQKNGLEWLWFLYEHQLSGLLCDEMGLGKTHQAMALFAAILNLSLPYTPKFLVVCPTSLLYHWEEKLAAFLPKAKVFTYHGVERQIHSFQKDADILLTSYGIWRNDVSILKQIPFEVAVFDELQTAKNFKSRLHQTLTATLSKMRLGLTGTPIENDLRELKSLFDIVLPGYMPKDHHFQRLFLTPIQKHNDLKQQELLTRYIKPFILRRRKKDVLHDLPEKVEQISHCDLHPSQRKIYHEVLLSSRDRILSELYDSTMPIPYMHIFTLLSYLKQICNHPALYFKKPLEFHKYHSGKWNLFLELLHEARESKQKVVVFSQYLGMLDIIESYLKQHSIGFAGIRGATKDRGKQVNLFQNDPSCEVFVASLKAAGLGIDLTSGSVVIHYDRWWNAARENQATDRVHRIGQTKGVQVFKLVTKETIEQKIDTLIERKGTLMEKVVGVDEPQVLKQLSREEIIHLLDTTDMSLDNF